MTINLTGLTPILNVSDIATSLRWFENLGWKRCWTFNDGGLIADAAESNEYGTANFAAVAAAGLEIFRCRDGQGSRGIPPRAAGDEGTGGVWMSWWLQTPDEVDAVYEAAVRKGVMISWPPNNEPWGARECRIVHPDGHTFRVSRSVGVIDTY